MTGADGGVTERAARRAEARERRARARRRLAALAAVAAVAVVAGAVIGAGSDDGDDSAGGVGESEAAIECPPEVAADPRRLTGQMVVARMELEATTGLRRLARDGELGGVVLFPPADAEPRVLRDQTDALRRAAAAGDAPRPLVMVDQEGGEVKRFPDAPPDQAPAELAAVGAEAAFAAGRETARALARMGIDVDLAPVLDSPTVPGAFIASRAFGSDPRTVSAAGVAFGEGLDAGGVAATAKHFPGLGTATVNTDLAPSTLEGGRGELAPGLRPFEAAIEAGFGLVMVANATYPAYDARRPASQSPNVVGELLRDRLGYDGVVVTDDLGAGALVQAGIDEAEAAVAAAGAGADLLLFALSDGEAARAGLLRALRRGELDRAALVESCARTTALRAALSP